MHFVIWCGGLGKRLRPSYAEGPKSLAPVNGVPFLVYMLDYLLQFKPSLVTLLCEYKVDQIKKTIGDRYGGVPVVYACDQTAGSGGLGTGGSLKQFLLNESPHDELIYLMNGDTLCNVNFQHLKFFMEAEVPDAPLAVCLAQKHDPDGRYTSPERIDERVTYDPRLGKLVSMGVYSIRPEGFVDHLRMYGESGNFEDWIFGSHEMLRIGYFYRQHHEFVDIGTPDDYLNFCTEIEGT